MVSLADIPKCLHTENPKTLEFHEMLLCHYLSLSQFQYLNLM